MFINSSTNPRPTNRFHFRLFVRLGDYFDGSDASFLTAYAVLT